MKVRKMILISAAIGLAVIVNSASATPAKNGSKLSGSCVIYVNSSSDPSTGEWEDESQKQKVGNKEVFFILEDHYNETFPPGTQIVTEIDPDKVTLRDKEGNLLHDLTADGLVLIKFDWDSAVWDGHGNSNSGDEKSKGIVPVVIDFKIDGYIFSVQGLLSDTYSSKNGKEKGSMKGTLSGFGKINGDNAVCSFKVGLKGLND